MKNFEGTVGFITGAAGGIGFAVAEALAQRGMMMMLADIEADTLADAAQRLAVYDTEIATVVLDVSDLEAYQHAATATLERFGKVNFLFNNAGVGAGSFAGEGAIDDWRWVINVNLLGVVYGVECFLPGMRLLDEPCHILNTASMAGHVAHPGMGAYTATKYAVVGYSETLEMELIESNVGVSVLCPAWVKTRIADSRRNHPDGKGLDPQSSLSKDIAKVIEDDGMLPAEVAQMVISGMANEELYLFTHPEFWSPLEQRMDRVRGAYQRITPI